jgi:hypothetical protein
MFADPISITIAGVANSFARVSTSGKMSVYQTSDGLKTLTISHTPSGTRVRTMSKLEIKKIVTNPLDATNDYDVVTTYTVEDRPAFGFTNTEIKDQVTGLNSFTGLSATQDKLLNTES